MDINLLRSLIPQYRQHEVSTFAEQVIGYYGQIFHPSKLENLTADEFLSFLRYANNKHWYGIARQGSLLTEDMDRLRDALRILLDESMPIRDRLDILFPSTGEKFIKGLGRAVATPVLLVVYPEKYGVFNSISEQGLHHIGAFPDLPRGASFAEQYMAVNSVLQHIAHELGVSLWALDALWWFLPGDEPIETITQDDEEELVRGFSFSLERYLSDYLYEHWQHTEFAAEWELYEEDGEVAREYITRIGRIDLLARHRDSGDWLVIELKRDRSSDAVVGQILRYMGWIKRHKAEPGEQVRGLILMHSIPDEVKYALSAAPGTINVMTYHVNVAFTSGVLEIAD